MSRKRTMTDLVQDEYRVHMIRTLVHMPKRDEATKLLQQLVNHTRILMKRKHWKVGLLCEFYPKNKQLLGLNMNSGSKIMIRLRDQNDNNQFLRYESLLGTMIHELVHIEIHAHSYDFYKMVDDLSIEVQTDMISVEYREYTAEMEFGKGQKLGGNTLATRKKDSKDLIREAALRRNQTLDHDNGNSSSVEGRKLGGDSNSLVVLTPRELRLQAIERRLKITNTTTSNHKPIVPEKQFYSPQSEITCGDQMSQEDFDFIMENTQTVPIIDLIEDDYDNYQQKEKEDNFSENQAKLPLKERKVDKNSLHIEEMLTQEYCAPCYPSLKNQFTSLKNEVNTAKIKKSNDNFSSSSLVEVIVLEDDDEKEIEKISQKVREEQWKCQICLEKNRSMLSRCSWCGLERC